MSVTAQKTFIDEDVKPKVETPAEAIELVFEELDLDPRTYQPRLDRETLLDYFDTLCQGYGCSAEALPPPFGAVATVAQLDEGCSFSTSAFIDMLWEQWQLLGIEEEAS